jgi:hypothetical protein
MTAKQLLQGYHVRCKDDAPSRDDLALAILNSITEASRRYIIQAVAEKLEREEMTREVFRK